MVDAEGAAKQRLTKGTMLCVRTSAGNIARLRTMFDAVIWKAS
ncbi:hypothetical protein [Streptomyces eurythermus]